MAARSSAKDSCADCIVLKFELKDSVIVAFVLEHSVVVQPPIVDECSCSSSVVALQAPHRTRSNEVGEKAQGLLVVEFACFVLDDVVDVHEPC